jgi:ribose transport system substrate-binding protein
MKRIFLFSLAAIALVGCGSSGSNGTESSAIGSDATSSAAKKLRIAVIPKGATHEFWKSIHEGADKAAAELGNVEIIWKGPLKEDDREDQIKVVEDFTTQKVDGIVLAPLDDTALRIPVDEAQKAGIPVLIIDSGLKDIATVSFVATDNYEAGKRGGMQMVELLGKEPKKVIVLRYQEGSASTTERENGFLDALKTATNITIISSNQFAGSTVETAQKASENLLAAFKQFDGVLCPNESSTFGMMRALQDAGLAGNVKFVGFDASSKLVEGLNSGHIDALMVQNPRKMGYLGVKTMASHLRKETVEKRIDTGAEVVTKANMSEPTIAELLAPPKG